LEHVQATKRLADIRRELNRLAVTARDLAETIEEKPDAEPFTAKSSVNLERTLEQAGFSVARILTLLAERDEIRGRIASAQRIFREADFSL